MVLVLIPTSRLHPKTSSLNALSGPPTQLQKVRSMNLEVCAQFGFVWCIELLGSMGLYSEGGGVKALAI